MSSVIRAPLPFLMPSCNRAQLRFLRLAEVLQMTGMGKIQASEGSCQERSREASICSQLQGSRLMH